MDRLAEMQETINRFCEERDWTQFHTPANLAKSISIEAAELLECFQWSDADYKREEVSEELADVLNYCIRMASVLDLDIIEIVMNKVSKNEIKYPLDKAKGVSTKYDQL